MPIDYSTGYVKVPRAALAAIGADPTTLATFLTLCDRARWDGPAARNTGRGTVRLDVGQCYVGRDELAAIVGTSPRSIRTALERLESLGIIRRETTNRGTTITLVGYTETYGGSIAARPANDQQNNPPTNDQQNDQQNDQPNDQQAAADSLGESWACSGVAADGDQQNGQQNDQQIRHETTTNGYERREQGASPGSDLGSGSVHADPDREAGGDRVHARGSLTPLVNRFLTRVNAARAELAAKHNLGPQRPVALMGQGGDGERELRARLAASLDPAGDLDHVLDVAIAEADAERELRWLGWSLASVKGWRSRLLATVAEVSRPRGRRRGPGSAAPRNDHGTEAADCSEVFG